MAHGIAESQSFIDANKRLALVAMLTFLELNGYRVEASDPDLAGWILSFSSGTTPQQLAPSVRDAMQAYCVAPTDQRGPPLEGRGPRAAVPATLPHDVVGVVPPFAAAAESRGLTVLHYDADFDRIASVTGQSCEWVVPAGSVD